jgi:hypothetical protein
MEKLEAELKIALRHVAEAREIVARQRDLIAKLTADNLPTRGDEALLDTFIATLACLEYHAQLLESEIDAAKKGIEPWKGLPP